VAGTPSRILRVRIAGAFNHGRLRRHFGADPAVVSGSPRRLDDTCRADVGGFAPLPRDVTSSSWCRLTLALADKFGLTSW
jgi:hypothetical protein